MKWNVRWETPARWLSQLVEPAVRAPLGSRLEQLAAAQQEWQDAVSYFQSVTEPELVDHAIFVLEAARRKYEYLMGQVRRGAV